VETAAAYFRENAENWDAIRSLYTAEADVEAAILSLLDENGLGEVLDIGTGTGRILTILSPRINKGIGVDMSREMLSVARSNLDQAHVQNCQVRQGDMYNLGLPSVSVDVAVFHQVLHYAEDPLAAVYEAGRVVRSDGQLLVVDFAPHGLEFLRTEHAHRRLGFADEEVASWCRAAGFEDVSVSHLEGNELTVSIWLARRNGARPAKLRVVETVQ
ncbi:MAG: class I SAM-dependent methyltransferase, partial [Proteobacteria bacterium]|nr:class I SAM-dependent methyltransferase [Pseudomonadota bacterium]